MVTILLLLSFPLCASIMVLQDRSSVCAKYMQTRPVLRSGLDKQRGIRMQFSASSTPSPKPQKNQTYLKTDGLVKNCQKTGSRRWQEFLDWPYWTRGLHHGKPPNEIYIKSVFCKLSSQESGNKQQLYW